MNKLFLSMLLLALPLLASAYDISVDNADGVTIYYNYYNIYNSQNKSECVPVSTSISRSSLLSSSQMRSQSGWM